MVINETNNVISLVEEIAQTNPSRELSLVKTKLEEAVMWAERAAALAEKKEQRKDSLRPMTRKPQR